MTLQYFAFLAEQNEQKPKPEVEEPKPLPTQDQPDYTENGGPDNDFGS